MKNPIFASLEEYKKFLRTKKLSIIIPETAYNGGRVSITDKSGNDVECDILNHPNCCGSKLLHSATEDFDPKIPIKYAIAGALLWCKMHKNVSATYIVSDEQANIEEALVALKFKCVQDVHNPKSGNHFRTYIINPQTI